MSLHHASLLNPTTSLDGSTPAFGILELSFRRSQIDGSEPFIESVEFDRSIAPSDLLSDFDIIGAVIDPSVARVHARSSLGGVLVRAFSTSTFVVLSSSTPDGAARLADMIRQRGGSVRQDDHVSLRTWNIDQAIARSTRRIDTPRWSEIADNYPDGVRAEIAQLVGLQRPTSNGKLILWHGPPGVGKTTAIRSLMGAWSSWCQPEYISDPERFFGEARYLLRVLQEGTGPSDGPRIDRPAHPEFSWRLIVAEDCDEYLRPSARDDAGAGLGRLLNLADGLLGQGHNALILLSTNEDLSRLHPAVIRPGRCLAKTHFRKFNRSEAAEWLRRRAGNPADVAEMTLAELLEKHGELRPLGSNESQSVAPGQYL